ncbi:MAG: tetratricopeptide (TPR) repeat protein [Crocinitomicaceae bacterium]|jgi:tetratricopeptide (TPR) repeat protein
MDANQPYKNKTIFLIIMVLCFLVYGNSLQNGYNLDDGWAFQNKGEADLLTGLQNSFTSTLVSIGDVKYGYRPVSSAVFELEQAVFGQNPFVSHLINILLFVVICYSLFIWLNKHVEVGWRLAVLITAVFLFLPIHTEVVNSIKNRDELLSSFFGIWFLIWSWKYYKKGTPLFVVIAAVLFVASLLSKTSSLPLLAVVPIGLWITSTTNVKRLVVLSIVPLLAFYATRISTRSVDELAESKQTHSILENPLYGDYSSLDKAKVCVNSFGFYLTGMVSTTGFNSYYGFDTINFLKWHTGYLCAVIVFVLAGLFLLIKYFKNRENNLAFFGLFMMFACLTPFLNLLFIVPGVVGERLAFLSSVGFAILLAVFIHVIFNSLQKAKKKPYFYIFYACLSILTILWSAKIVTRNKDWFDMETLMAADLEKYPKSVKMNMIMGSLQFNKGVRVDGKTKKVHNIEQVKRAREYFGRALETYKDHATAIYNIAWIDTYVLDGDAESTEESLWRIVEMELMDSAAVLPLINHLNLKNGETKYTIDECMELCKTGNREMGLTGLRIALNGSNWDYFWAFSECLYDDVRVRRKQVTELWKRTMSSNPEQGELLSQELARRDGTSYFGKLRAQHLMRQEKFPDALFLLGTLNSKFENDKEIKLLIGNVNLSLDNKEQALFYFKEALALDPENEQLKGFVNSFE